MIEGGRAGLLFDTYIGLKRSNVQTLTLARQGETGVMLETPRRTASHKGGWLHSQGLLVFEVMA